MARTFVQEIDLDTGVVLSERHFLNGKPHRPATEGPAVIVRDTAGGLESESYWWKGAFHSEIGPALVLYEGHQVSLTKWYHHGTFYCNPEGDQAWLAKHGREFDSTYAPLQPAEWFPHPAKREILAP